MNLNQLLKDNLDEVISTPPPTSINLSQETKNKLYALNEKIPDPTVQDLKSFFETLIKGNNKITRLTIDLVFNGVRNFINDKIHPLSKLVPLIAGINPKDFLVESTEEENK